MLVSCLGGLFLAFSIPPQKPAEPSWCLHETSVVFAANSCWWLPEYHDDHNVSYSNLLVMLVMVNLQVKAADSLSISRSHSVRLRLLIMPLATLLSGSFIRHATPQPLTCFIGCLEEQLVRLAADPAVDHIYPEQPLAVCYRYRAERNVRVLDRQP
jgi:hypothetical protein